MSDATRFEIAFASAHEAEPPGSPTMAIGYLAIGDEVEWFEAALSYWSRTEYENQWTSAIEALVDGASVEALITSIHDPLTANFIEWWPLYRDENLVRIQNHVLLLDEVRDTFDLQRPSIHVPAWSAETEEGDSLSTWTVSISDLRRFLASR